jgi:predicted N-formylglutamate amidohydrolase
MTSDNSGGLLTSRDAGPVMLTNPAGASRFLLLGDHAGNLVPERLGSLGLDQATLGQHIALDLGVSELGQVLSASLDAPFIEQRYSRLVIDCNRSLDDPTSIAGESDGVDIPANGTLSPADRSARIGEIFEPYHDAIDGLLAQKDRAGKPVIVVSLHSFTPSLNGMSRPWEVGVLHGGGRAEFARAVLFALGQEDLVVGDNQPYRFDGTDYTVPRHAFLSGRYYVELEIRQDMLANSRLVRKMAGIISNVLRRAATLTHPS